MVNHKYGNWACIRCGQSYESILDNITSAECVATPNVIEIANRLQNEAYNRDIAAVTGRWIKK